MLVPGNHDAEPHPETYEKGETTDYADFFIFSSCTFV